MSGRNWLFVLAVLLGVVKADGAEEPRPAASKPEIDQLVRQLASSVFRERKAACRRLESIGRPALDALHRAARSDDLEVRRRAESVIRHIEQEDQFLIEGMSVRAALGAVSVEMLLTQPSPVEVKKLARFCCAKPQALRTLFASLEDPDIRVRVGALMILAECRPLGVAAIPKLMQRLQIEECYFVRWLIVAELPSLALVSDNRLPWLVRRWIVGALEPVLLERVAKDPEPYVRATALSSLREARASSKCAITALVKALSDEDVRVRIQAASGLAATRDSRAAVPAILATIRSQDQKKLTTDADFPSDGRLDFAEALAELGVSAFPGLRAALTDDKPSVRACAVLALGLLSGRAKLQSQTSAMTHECVRLISALLHDREPLVRKCAADALRSIGQAAEPATTLLIESLYDANTTVQTAAVYALGAIGPSAAACVPHLIKRLGGDELTAIAAVRALGSMGSKAQTAVPALIRLFANGKDSRIPVFTADTLGKIGPGAKEAVPVLLERLRGEKGRYVGLRDAILGAIKRIDPEACPKVETDSVPFSSKLIPRFCFSF